MSDHVSLQSNKSLSEENDEFRNNREKLPSNDLYNVDFTQLTSNALSMFDIRHWYRISRHALRAGEDVINDVLRLFRENLTQLTSESVPTNTICLLKCPVCLAHREGKKVIVKFNESLEHVPENNRECFFYISTASGGWQDRSTDSEQNPEMRCLNSEVQLFYEIIELKTKIEICNHKKNN